MVLTRAKIKALEAKVKKKQAKSDKSNLQLAVPEDWASFARMVKIRSGGDVKPFDPYPYQIELVDLMLERSVCVVKSRQLGISETITCFMLWRACQNPGYLGLVFSKTQQDSSLLARRMKRMISSLGLRTATENLSDIEILGCGRILFRNSNPDSARGIESVVDVFLDELAFLETGKDVYDALAPSMQMCGDDARVFAVSTPNGKAGFYWNLLSSWNGDRDIEMLCNEVSKGNSEPFQHWIDEGGWGKILIHWRTHPIYGKDESFLENIRVKQKLSLQTINQEYNLSFLESELNYFNYESIKLGAIGAYEEPQKGLFFIGIDAATTGEDYAVGVVLQLMDDGKFNLVHLYRKRNQTTEYHLYHLSEIITIYRPVSVAVEVTGGTGQVWFETLARTHFQQKIERIHTTGDSKPVMLDRMKLLLEKGKLTYPANSPIVEEMLNFRRNDKKLEAAQGKHDDVVLSVAFALNVAENYT